MNARRTQSFFLILVFAISVFVINWFFFPPEDTLAVDLSNSFDKEVVYLRTEIHKQGAEQVVEKLENTVKVFSQSNQHLYGHILGQALYDEVGIDWFFVCEERFYGGCAHEFLGSAVLNEGIDTVKEMSAGCKERRGARLAVTCEHGLGHGLVSYFGYTTNDLLRALSICNDVESINSTRGCYGGAFMEFNLRTMANNELRPFLKETPFALCDSVLGEHKRACYFWHAQWLLDSLSNEPKDIEVYKSAGDYCNSVENAEWVSVCFQGLGYSVSGSPDFNPSKPKEFCDAISDIQKNRDDCWLVVSE